MNNNEKQPKVTVDYIKKVLGTSSTGTVKNPSNNRATYDLLNKVTNTVPALDVSSNYDSQKNVSNSSNTVTSLQSGTPQYIKADVKDITSKAGKTIRDGINYKGDTFLGEQELIRRGKEINSANSTIPFLQVASNVFGKFGSNPISNYFDNKIAEQQEKIDSAKDLSKYSSQQIKDAYDGIRNYSGVERTLLDFDGSKSALNTMKQAMTPEYNENLRRDVINSLVSSNSLEQFKTAYAPTNTIQEGFLFSGIGDDIVASDSQKNLRKLLANKTGYSEEDLRSVAEYLLKNNAMDSIAEYADEHPVIASAFSVPVNLVGHLQGAANSAISGITGSPIDSEGMGYSLQDMSNTARQTVSDNIENPLGKFVYGTGMSMADSLAAMVIGGGNPAVTSAIMATGAYSETAQEGAERGLTPSQIQTTAIAAGAFEYLFEKISWDKLNLIAKGEASKNILANIATQAFTEGAEEVGTDFANMLVDNLVNGGAAEMVKLHDFYMESGMTDSEAQAEVMKQMAKQLVSSFAGGALSGGVMGGGASVVSRVTGRGNASQLQEENSTEQNNNNEINLAQATETGKYMSASEVHSPSGETGPVPAAQGGASSLSNNSISNSSENVNTQQKIRGYNDSITEKSDLPDDIKNEFISNPQYYEVLSNKTTLENANRIIDSTDSNGALSQFNRLLDQKNPTAIPLGYNLSKQLRQEGRFDEAVDVLRRMSEKLTESGQFSQAAAITLMNNDPDMALKYVIREIDNLNVKGREKYKGKWVDFELTESEKQAFSKLEAGDAEGIKSLYNSIFERIQRQYPSTMKEKLLEFRRVSMLLNVRTNVRNVVSNAMLMPVRWTADRVSALGQNFVKLMNPDAKTTQAVIVNKKAKALAKEAWSTVSDTILGSDGKYEDVKGAIRNKQVFKGGKIASFIDNVTNGAITKLNQMMGKDITPSITETLRNFTYWLLQKGDDGFVRMNFESRMASYIAAQKITDLESIPADAYTLATQEAMKATFKDDTALARMLQNVKQNTGIVGEVVLPFTKTPANLAMRGYDYSIGGVVDFLKMLENKNRTWNDVTSTMDSISKSVVGIAAIAAGYALAKAGLITGPLSDDKDEEMFQRAMGMLPYAIKIGQNYYSYDWAQPAAIPIIFGATIYNAAKESDTALNAFKQGGLAAIDSWFNLSPLQNVQDIFGGYGTPAENITDVMIQTPLSFIPAQLGALARTADTTQRVTYSDNPFEYLKNSAMSKVPFLSEQLPASYDAWGNEIKRSDSTGEAAFAQLINPGQVGNSNVTPIDSEITRLFDSTGDSAVFPQKASWSYTINGESVKLDNEQYSEMQRRMGELSYDAAEYFIGSDLYDKLSDDQKVSMMKDIYSFAQANAKHELLEYDIAGNNTYKKAYNAYEQGGVEDLVNFFYIKTALNGHSSIAATVEVVDSMGISDSDKGYYLSQKIDLSQAAQEAFQNSGYAGVYQYYSEKVAAEKEKESSSGKITQEYIHNVLTGNSESKPKITLEYIHNVLNGSN